MKKTKFLTVAVFIAALYVVMTFVSSVLGVSSGVIQVRFSEALTILPLFTPAAIPGLFIGCLLANLLTGAMIFDVIFGSLATLAGAVFTYFIGKLVTGKKSVFLGSIPPIAANTIVIPFILKYVYAFEGSIWYFVLTVGAGEVLSCGLLGCSLAFTLQKYGKQIDW